MKIFAFPSAKLSNIWAGVGAGRWAVSKSTHDSVNKRRATLAAEMPIGSFGVLYLSGQGYTTPFVVISEPNYIDPESKVWPEDWFLAFDIKPLGNPSKILSRKDALRLLPSMARKQLKNVDDLIYTKGVQTFVPSEIGEDDWSVLIKELAV
ncbi:MAG: hypothetical protein LH610_09255 [Sphingomonas bacterium]|nr:hypothetical protein [Sphingomonas bacterium]